MGVNHPQASVSTPLVPLFNIIVAPGGSKFPEEICIKSSLSRVQCHCESMPLMPQLDTSSSIEISKGP